MSRGRLDEPLIVGELLGESRPMASLLVADAATALVESGEGSHYAGRADTPGSVTRQLAARHALAESLPEWCSGAGREPNATVHVIARGVGFLDTL